MFSESEVQRIVRLLGEMRELRHDPQAAHQHLVDQLAALVGAEQGFSYVVRGLRRGCEPMVTHLTLCSDPADIVSRYKREFGAVYSLLDDPLAAAVSDDHRDAGITSLRCVFPDRAKWSAFGAWFDLVESDATRDAVTCYVRGAGDITRGLSLHRFGGGGARLFGDHELRVIQFVLGEVVRMYEAGRLLPLDHPVTRLSPRQAEVLKHVLEGAAPKDIARSLGISMPTVREYLRAIYRQLGVCGREQLMAKLG